MKTIKSKRDFEAVFKGGRRINHPLVRVTVLPGEEGVSSKVAFVAAKRLGNAVYRNRCKRILRAAVQQSNLPPTGYEVILFSTNKTHEATSTEVAQALNKLITKFDNE